MSLAMIQKQCQKAAVSVVEMAEMVRLSKSRFYDLMRAGVFPTPVQQASCKRPVFDRQLQDKCLEVKRTGVGFNGQPIVFNKKRKTTRTKKRQPTNGRHSEFVDALKSLGLSARDDAVEEALQEVYPDGHEDTDHGEVVRRVFLHLQQRS